MEKITFGDDNLPGYITGPADAPALIVLQEWWGVNDIIKAQAEAFSALGFRCLVPDLYKGKRGIEVEEAQHLMSNLDFKQAVQEIKQAVQYLRDTGAKSVGAVGFCMGGALAFCAAQHAGIDAAVPFYGTPDPAICQVESIKVPVQMHFGDLDVMQGFSDPATAIATLQKMKAAGAEVELTMHPASGHGFMNAMINGIKGVALLTKAGNPVPPKEEVEKAFNETIAFLKKHMLAF